MDSLGIIDKGSRGEEMQKSVNSEFNAAWANDGVEYVLCILDWAESVARLARVDLFSWGR